MLAHCFGRLAMRRLLIVLALLLVAPAVAQEPVALTDNEMTDWSGGEGDARVFTSGDLTMTLALSGDDSERIATLRIEKPGTAPVELSGLGAGFGFGQVGVVDFDDNGMRSVIFATYAGGAHCCMQTEAATETPNGFVTGHVTTIDGDMISPEALDGDGVYEIPIRDDRFNYLFDAYAFSFPPPLVLKSKDGVVYDASHDPAFRPLFEDALEAARAECSGETWNLGPCGAVLAIAARFGTYEAELAPIKAALAAGKRTSGWDDFSFCDDADCTTQTTFTDFVEAAEHGLRLWGYLPQR